MGNKKQLTMRGALAVAALAALLAGCGDSGNKTGNTEGNSIGNTIDNQGGDESVKNSATAVTPDNLHELLLARETDAIYAKFSSDFKKQIQASELKSAIDQVLANIDVLEPASKLDLNGQDMRMWTDKDKTLGVIAMFDSDGTIVGLQLQDITVPEQSPPQLTKNTYDFPFHGEWFVFWGGENVLVNYHYAFEDQRFAYDLVIVKDGYSYDGDPLKNESYYAFGQPLLAPADGVVVSVVNDIPDNEPVGVMNEKHPAGNAVVIDHGGEFSTLAHLKQGSATVKVGDTVKKGDVIGQTGNSGNSSEAHLHYQVSDGADLFSSKSLNIQWSNGLKPVQGDTISGSAE